MSNQPTFKSFTEVFCPQTRTALKNYWGNNDILTNPEHLAELGAETIIRIKGVGIKSISRIAIALHQFGYIENPDLWLKKKKS